jgi:hypothetical protein
MAAGQSFGRGQALRSCNNQFSLQFQADGSLAEIFTPDGSVATGFFTPGGTIATMQSDGNFVVRDAASNLLMQSETAGHNGAYLFIRDDGFINIYMPLGNPAGGTGGALPALWSMAPGG